MIDVMASFRFETDDCSISILSGHRVIVELDFDRGIHRIRLYFISLFFHDESGGSACGAVEDPIVIQKEYTLHESVAVIVLAEAYALRSDHR